MVSWEPRVGDQFRWEATSQHVWKDLVYTIIKVYKDERSTVFDITTDIPSPGLDRGVHGKFYYDSSAESQMFQVFKDIVIATYRGDGLW